MIAITRALTVAMITAFVAAVPPTMSAQDRPRSEGGPRGTYVRVGGRGETAADGVLYEPAGAPSRIALLFAHPGESNFNHAAGREMARRGYRILMINHADDVSPAVERGNAERSHARIAGRIQWHVCGNGCGHLCHVAIHRRPLQCRRRLGVWIGRRGCLRRATGRNKKKPHDNRAGETMDSRGHARKYSEGGLRERLCCGRIPSRYAPPQTVGSVL